MEAYCFSPIIPFNLYDNHLKMVMLPWYYRWWNWKPEILTAVSSFTARKEQRQNTKFILLESSKPKSHTLFISFYTALPSGILFWLALVRSAIIMFFHNSIFLFSPFFPCNFCLILVAFVNLWVYFGVCRLYISFHVSLKC